MLAIAPYARSAVNWYRAGRDMRKAVRSIDGGAVKRALERTLAGERPSFLSTIERRRSLLLADNTDIEVVDFGAGSATDSRSSSQQMLGMTIRTRISDSARASKPERWARFLYFLTLETEPQHVLELGTCVGISGAYIASGLRAGATLTTLEGDPERARISRETFSRLQQRNVNVVTGPFHETLKSVLTANQFDLVFIDGHHDQKATVDYFEAIQPNLSSKAIVVFDDIRWSAGMERAWQEVSQRKRSFDLSAIGIVEC